MTDRRYRIVADGGIGRGVAGASETHTPGHVQGNLVEHLRAGGR